MSDIKITTFVELDNVSIETVGKTSKIFKVSVGGVGMLPYLTLNQLLDLGKCIDAMSKEMAKIDLSDSGDLFKEC